MQNSSSKFIQILLIGILIALLFIIAKPWLFKNDISVEQELVSQEEQQETQVNQEVKISSVASQDIKNKSVWKFYLNEDLRFSFSYPPTYYVEPYGVSNFSTQLITDGNNKYFFSEFDIYKSITGPKAYKSEILNNENSEGILFWRSNGSGPSECHDDLECVPYSDEFQFGARFEVADNQVITFSNGKIFRDGKESHTLDDVKNLPEFKDFFEIIKTFETLN